MTDLELYKGFQKSPLFFIEKNFGLVPQGIKPEYKLFVESSIESGNFELVEVNYFKEFIKGENITWQQFLLFKAVERAIQHKGNNKISVSSGHGTGKSSSLALLILWFLFCFKDAQVPCTAPSSEQMHDVLWKELALWLGKMKPEIKNLYEWKNDRVEIKERAETWFARAKTARKENPEALAGVHSDNVMLLVDEASGVAEEIYNTAQGALTNDNILFIMISNPTRLIGYFYDSHHVLKDQFQTLKFNSEDSPIVNHKFVEDVIRRHGKESDEYKIRVRGEFPMEDAIDEKGYLQLIKKEDLRFTTDNRLVGKVKMGIDCAGEGKDRSRWVIRDQFRAILVATEDKSTEKTIARKTIMLLEEYKIKDYDTYVDNFGVGANVGMEIARSGNFVNGINVGDEAREDPDNLYINIRAEASFRMKKWLQNGGELYGTDKWDDLLLPRYTRNERGKIKMMSKLEMRKLGYRSPDVFDALLLTFIDEIEQEAYKKEDEEDEDVRDRFDKYSIV